MNILGIDQASKCGWAVITTELMHVASGVVQNTDNKPEPDGMKYIRFRSFLYETHLAHDPALVVYEKPVHPAGLAAGVLAGAWVGHIQEYFEAAEVPYRSVWPSSLKKWATGNGRAGKDEMVRAAKLYFPEVRIVSDDHADALLIAAYGVSLWNQEQRQR